MSEHEGHKRAKFSGRIGFVLAAAASAVGLGNLWRFPWLTSHYGGGIFVLIYIILAVTFGFSLLMAEVAIGRKTGKSCVKAFGDLCAKFKWFGYFVALIPLIISSYYFVIGGWTMKWFVMSATDSATLTTGGYWWGYITGAISGIADPAIWFVAFAGLCFLCVILGVDKGIEKVSMVLMPTLLILTGVIIIYEMTIPGIWDGVVYYLNPDVSKLSGGTFLGAVSQIFYSLSIAMGIMITYGSYMRKEDNIEKSVRNISMIDTCTAIIMGMMIVPIAAIYGLGDNSGMGLMFVAMPQVFATMPGGAIIGPVFYLLVIFAAMTSAVSLLEAVVSQFCDALNIKRKKSIILSLCVLIPLGIIVVLGFGPLMTDFSPFDQGAGWLGIFDTLTNTIMMPIVAIITCLFISLVIGTDSIVEEIEYGGHKLVSKNLFVVMIKYACPILLTLMLVLGLADMYGLLNIY